MFQNPRIGGDVGAHKDNTYLITHPHSCTGIWVSMDEASKTNGCMWGVPGSHAREPRNYMKRKYNDDGHLTTYLDPHQVQYEYSHDGAIPLEVPPGSIVLLHGNFLHYSEKNTSDK